MNRTLDAPSRSSAGTSAAAPDLLIPPRDDARCGWNALMVGRLMQWEGAGGPADEDGFEPPSEAVVVRAYRLAARMRNAGHPPPDRVVPDGDGGLAFERRDGQLFQSLHVYDDLTVELDLFEGVRLVRTEVLNTSDDEG